MNDFLKRFEALSTLPQQEKFLIEINARIEHSAYFTDQLKKSYKFWDRETEDLCIVRDLLIQKMKENR